MKISALAYDSSQKSLKAIKRFQTFRRASVFVDRNGKIFSFLLSPNQIVPGGILLEEKEFKKISALPYIEKSSVSGKPVELSLKGKMKISQKVRGKTLRKWASLNDPAKEKIERLFSAGRFCEMVGLGGGLTPLGDDFLVGIIAAFYLKKKKFGYKLPLSKTNLISAYFISKALKGKFASSVGDFVSGKSDEIFSFGATTPIAVACGILKGENL